MNTTYKQQIEAIQTAIKLIRGRGFFNPTDEGDKSAQDVISALNDAGSSLAALNLSDPYKEIERLQAELKKANEAISHYADVNQNQ